MPANTYAGEVSITDADEGREYIFRPSFFALGQLSSDPRSLLDMYADIQKGDEMAFLLAHDVLEACYAYTDRDNQQLCAEELAQLHTMIGRFNESGLYIDGKCAVACIHALGVILLNNGMAGRPTGQNGKKLKEFNPGIYVGMASAHLGRSDGWNMTMMELQDGLRAKFPPEEKDDIPEPTEAQMSYYEKALQREAMKRG